MIGNYHYLDESRPAEQRGKGTQFILKAADPNAVPALVRSINQMFRNSGTPTDSASQRLTLESLQNAQGHRTFAIATVGGAGLFMILVLMANGIAQSVRQRTSEFAVMKTVGFRNVHIMGLVFAEVALPCLLGAIGGTLIAILLARWPMKFMHGELFDLPAPTLSIDVILRALAAALVIACASAAAPLIRVSRTSVASQLAQPRT